MVKCSKQQRYSEISLNLVDFEFLIGPIEWLCFGGGNCPLDPSSLDVESERFAADRRSHHIGLSLVWCGFGHNAWGEASLTGPWTPLAQATSTMRCPHSSMLFLWNYLKKKNYNDLILILFYFFTKKCLNFEIGNIYLFIISYFTNFCYKKKKIVYANYVLCLNVDIVKKMKKRKEKSMLWNSSFFFF